MTKQDGKPVHKEDASPQDTFTHIFGSGFTMYDWWLQTEEIGCGDNFDNVPADWKVRVVVEDGNGEPKEVMVDHATIIKACWEIIQMDHHIGMTESTVRNVGCLLFNNDSTDFDANSADELMQWITLGEVVFC